MTKSLSELVPGEKPNMGFMFEREALQEKNLLSTPGEIGKWLKHFPDAGVQKIAGANHFTQEDCPDNYVIAIRNIQATLDK